MEIKLQSLKLENFMKFRNFAFEPHGKNVELRSDNACGKTTIASGFAWLLFGKDVHQNSTDHFSIKTTDENDVVIPHLDHSVTGILNIDGIPLTLQKIYKEKWLKKRKVLTGHTTEYLINEVPVLKKDYDKRISEIIPEETFRLLTDINYFNSDQFGWQNRRKILFQLCEGLSEEALDAAEKAKKILASKKKTINEKKDGIQPRIDEKNRDLAAIADYNKAEIKARITDFEGQLQIIKSDSSQSALLKECAELEAKLSQNEADQAQKKQKATSGVRAKIEKTEDDYAKTKRIISQIESDIGQKTRTADNAKAEMADLRLKFDMIICDQDTGVDSVCPACGQDIPQNQRDAALAEFNRLKSEKLERINQTGKKIKGQKEKLTAEITKLENDLKLEQSDIAKIKKDLDKKKTDLEEIQQAINPISEEVKEMADRVADIENLLGQEDQKQDTVVLEAELVTERAKIAKIDAGEEHKIRIVELGEQEKALCAEIEKLEADLFKAEENIQDQARLLEIPINAKFELVKFKLFKPLMNGGVEPCCETLIDGIPYGHGLNKGNEINAGLDIVRTLSQYYQIQCPVFIDDCSLISRPIDPGCQCFKLINVKDMEKLEITYE